jgi:hypothetical protein
MSRYKILFVALIVALAGSACASAIASAAEPELVSSSYPIKYSGTIPAATWEVAGGSNFKCIPESSTDEGEITGPRTLTAVIHFKGCKAGGAWCTSPGAVNGEIITQPLDGTPVYSPKFGIAIVFKPKSGVNVVNTFKCIENAEVRGGIIAWLQNTYNKYTSTLNLEFAGSLGQQNPLWYYTDRLEKVYASLETSWLDYGSFQPLDWAFKNTLTLSGTVNPRDPA